MLRSNFTARLLTLFKMWPPSHRRDVTCGTLCLKRRQIWMLHLLMCISISLLVSFSKLLRNHDKKKDTDIILSLVYIQSHQSKDWYYCRQKNQWKQNFTWSYGEKFTTRNLKDGFSSSIKSRYVYAKLTLLACPVMSGGGTRNETKQGSGINAFSCLLLKKWL